MEEVVVKDYNSQRPLILLREYGRHVQELAEHLNKEEDKERRSELARLIISLMKQLNPAAREAMAENPQRVWDHLHVMAGFKLDIESPYEPPTPDTFNQKPERVPYDQRNLKFRNYGRNVELLLSQAMEMEDEEERLGAVKLIARLMRTFHAAWTKENLSSEVICEHIKRMSDGKLDYLDLLKEHPYIFDSVNPHKDSPQPPTNSTTNQRPRANHRNNRKRNKRKKNN